MAKPSEAPTRVYSSPGRAGGTRVHLAAASSGSSDDTSSASWRRRSSASLLLTAAAPIRPNSKACSHNYSGRPVAAPGPRRHARSDRDRCRGGIGSRRASRPSRCSRTAGQPFELDGPEQQAVAGFFEDPRPLVLNGRGGQVLEAYLTRPATGDARGQAAAAHGRRHGSARLRDTFQSQFDAIEGGAPARGHARTKSLGGRAAAGTSFFTTRSSWPPSTRRWPSPSAGPSLKRPSPPSPHARRRPGSCVRGQGEAEGQRVGDVDLAEIYSVEGLVGRAGGGPASKPLSMKPSSAHYGLRRPRAAASTATSNTRRPQGRRHPGSLDIVPWRRAAAALYGAAIGEVRDFPPRRSSCCCASRRTRTRRSGAATRRRPSRTQFRFYKLATPPARVRAARRRARGEVPVDARF